jgi:hypothetical protein
MSTSRGLALTTGLLVLLIASRASADVPPPNACSVVGEACSSAQTSTGFNGAGTCQASTCAHSGPLPDGAIGTTQNACTLCVAGPTAVSGSGGPASSSSSSSPNGSSSSGGCAAVGASPGFAPFALVAAGAAIVALSRRRRARR